MVWIVVWDRKIALGSDDLERVHMKDEYKERLRKWIGDRLRAGTMYVTFKKRGGENRKMRCTLHPVTLALYLTGVAPVPKQKSVDTLVVFDLDKNAWRSFTLDRVLKIEVETALMGGDFVWELAKDL